MSTTTKFLPYNDNSGAIARASSTWLEAARECLSYDGYAWECREITEADVGVNDDGNLTGLMGLWVRRRHLGNNVYIAEDTDFTGITSLRVGDAGVEHCLRQYQARGNGSLHCRYELSVIELTYAGTTLSHINGARVEDEAEAIGIEVDELRAQYA